MEGLSLLFCLLLTAFQESPSDDPCYSYTVLDEPWRATDYQNDSVLMCDRDVNWFGWYRLFIHGQSAQMPNTCIDEYKCGTHAPLWLNGEHPKVEDGVVTRGVCGHWNNNCCYYNSTPIRVKACPGDYYVYEFVRPFMCAVAYCADVGNINTIYTTITPETNSSEPCGGNMTDWRGVLLSPRYPNNYPNNAQCTWTIHSTGNTTVSLIFTDVDLETCCDYIKVYDGPSTHHPLLGEIREYRNQSFRSSSNDLTVLFYSDHSVTRRGFHANWVFVESPSDDPCYSYTVLDEPWRATDYQNDSVLMCDRDVNWFGWYRLFIHGQSAQMPKTCIDEYKCGTHAPLWLNGEHPKVEDGVVTRGVCGHWNNNCCYYNSTPIRVKACPGDYYVYEFVRPFMCAVAYCADVGDINTIYTTITPETNSSEPCGGNMTDWRGVLLSPRYPNNYPNNAQCTWTIHSTGNTTVSLIFTDVDLETCCDYIKVYDGPSTHHPLLGEIREYRNQSFRSSSNDLTVLFYSDHSVTRRGFHANWVFVVPQPECGGHLYGSGLFSSPNYPNYYHDNAYCVWYLSAEQGQRIFLTFADVQLERCCNCDYITVYDGSSTDHPQLGKVCFNDTSHQVFHSSSHYLTVVFRSDSSGVSHGFKALFTSSLTEEQGRVDCSSDNMLIVIQRSYLNSLGLNGNDLYVEDHLCRPTISSTEVVFSFPLNACGTAKQTMNGYVSYTNNVRASQSQSGEISHQSQFLLRVGCRMEPDTMVQIFYKAKEIINANITGTGRFNASIAFYTSSSFNQQIYDSPYEVNLNQLLYVQVALNRPDNSLDLFLDTCVASPNPNDFKDRSYDLLRNGCPRDNTYYSYTSGQHYYAQFSFRAFKFLRTHAYVYLQCKVIICPDNDYNSRCRQGCRFRRKRSLDSTYHTNTVRLGPIKLKGQRPLTGIISKELY
ncbi:CUB and zona pellucida-like domain-containing protein 1 [Carassius gibelio]|uniref:CUB and zona pellucida-like domain-containing protein 1 n=1 Tax=Carassius gibelio TaxID=101364 RepID=UPI002279824C|nr:CUB and zona pellucida-like domain-containing protein 1 [Carassius gibelio]